MLPIILATGSNARLLQGLKAGAVLGLGIGLGMGLFALVILAAG